MPVAGLPPECEDARMVADFTLILGGVSSGKSLYAEGLAEAAGRNRLYIATADVGDEEIRAKVAAHQARRGPGWTTVEAPLDLSGALAGASGSDVVLIDCLSMWLSNHLLAKADLGALCDDLVSTLGACPCPVIAVSNEVGLGGIEANALARAFARAQGMLNQRLASEADRVVLVTAGLPVVLKGTL